MCVWRPRQSAGCPVWCVSAAQLHQLQQNGKWVVTAQLTASLRQGKHPLNTEVMRPDGEGDEEDVVKMHNYTEGKNDWELNKYSYTICFSINEWSKINEQAQLPRREDSLCCCFLGYQTDSFSVLEKWNFWEQIGGKITGRFLHFWPNHKMKTFAVFIWILKRWCETTQRLWRVVQ